MDQNNYNNYYPQQDPAPQPQYQQPQYPQYQQPYQPQYQQPYAAAPVSAQPNLLVFGILSLVFSIVVGIILGLSGRKKGNAYIAQGGTLTGASKVGYILCKVGFILSIIATVFFIIYIIIIIAAASSGAYYYYY